MLCPTGAHCVQYKDSQDNTVMTYECCPENHKFCGATCVDKAINVCCHGFGGGEGMCAVNRSLRAVHVELESQIVNKKLTGRILGRPELLRRQVLQYR
jgi:hypothetical protein